MKIIILNMLTLLINIVLILIITSRFKKLDFLKEEYLSMQKNIEELLNENSYLSTLYLDGLEKKISEGKKIINTLTEKEKNWETKSPISNTKNNHDIYTPVTLEIVKMLEQGKSITEIAEELNTTKGEVALRLNLGKKYTVKN